MIRGRERSPFSPEFNGELAERVGRFLGRGRPEELTLTLDGLGVNSALQYAVLSLIGVERLKRFAEINVISGSSYAWFCFWALHHGQLRPGEDELRSWDKNHLRLSGVRPGATLAKLVAARFARRDDWLIPASRLSETLEYLVAPAVHSQALFELLPNLRFWLYDRTSPELVVASRSGEFSNMTVRELIQAMPNVPGVFSEFKFGGRSLMDPVYSPKRGEMYRTLAARSAHHLISNAVRNSEGQGPVYVKPHPFKNGRKMIQMDLFRFACGFRNQVINDSIQNGLFNPSIKAL